MSDEATIEDEVEVEESTGTSGPQTKTGLLPWSFILEIGLLIKLSFYMIRNFILI